jgi:AcrR family transcriptional regulator
MSPRRYDRRSRLAAAEETRRRIVRATVELHGRHGAVTTTHEMIARQAGVSLPTVYKYFPTRNDLIPHCTGLVLNESPVQLDESAFEGKSDVPSRLRALARRVFDFYDYAAPWLRWSARDAVELPALQAVLEAAVEARTSLLRKALTPDLDRTPPQGLMALAAVLLDFPSWQSLTASGYTSQAAAVVVGEALVSLCAVARKEKES